MILGVVLAVHVAGLADEDRVRLRIVRGDGAERCPADAALAARVRARIGSEPFREADDAREVRVGVARDGDGDELVARIVLFSPSGTRLGLRVLHGDADCRSLADDLVLAVAIAIDPLLLVRRRPPAPPRRPPTHARASPADGGADAADAARLTFAAPVDAPTATDAADASASASLPPAAADAGSGVPAPASVSGRALLLVASGVGVIATPSLRGQASFGYGVVDVDAGVRFDLPSRYPVGNGALLDVALLALDGSACLEWDPDAFVGLRGCGDIEAGALNARGIGLDNSRAVTAPWVAVGARGAVDMHIWPELGLVVQGDLLSPLIRPRLIDDVSHEVYAEPALVGWDLGIGAEVQIR